MSFWINSFRTPIHTCSVVMKCDQLKEVIKRWTSEVKIVLHIRNDWDYGIIVVDVSDTTNVTIKYGKNLKRGKFIDVGDIGNIPNFEEDSSKLVELIDGPGYRFVILGYFDCDNNFYAVEICDFTSKALDVRNYRTVDETLLARLRYTGFTTPIIESSVHYWMKHIEEVTSLVNNASLLVIPTKPRYDQAVLYKPCNNST